MRRSDDRPPPLPGEIAFLPAPAAVLAKAAQQARDQAVSPDAALLASGAVDEPVFYRSLAVHLGVGYVDGPIEIDPAARYPESIHLGFAPLAPGRGPRWLVAPREGDLTDLLGLARRGELDGADFVITTPANLSRLVRAASIDAIAWEASFALANFDPDFSARSGPSPQQRRLAMASLWILSLAIVLTPGVGASFMSLSVNALFLAAIFLRLFAGAASMGSVKQTFRAPLEDRRLPRYSIVVALHREARIVRQLAAALDDIDYPRGKLDIKLVIEADDSLTRQALESLRLPPIYEIVIAPPGWPRTKPRALNVALPLLRGEFVAVFDAEDTPAPTQLREAAERFLRAPKRVACLQARLSIDNVEDSWLTRLFSIEYAILFDVLHQGLAGLRLPLPLGGSSNHFRGIM
ncbi:glycosyltransferase [Methylocapsa palsarum]|nr:glycosyltransferase [Methylocapsa palsarum]